MSSDELADDLDEGLRRMLDAIEPPADPPETGGKMRRCAWPDCGSRGLCLHRLEYMELRLLLHPGFVAASAEERQRAFDAFDGARGDALRQAFWRRLPRRVLVNTVRWIADVFRDAGVGR